MKLESPFWKSVAQFRAKTDFTITVTALTNDLSSPNFSVYIQEIDTETERPITTLEFIINGDEYIRRYIQAHPLWQHDARPMILAMLDQFLWDIKIIETSYDQPFSIQLRFPVKQGGFFDIKMTASVRIDSGGDTIIHAVNYTNAFGEMVRRMGEEIPEAAPSPDYIADIQSSYKTEMLLRQQYTLAALKRQFNQPAKNQGGDIYAFVDESGDLGFRIGGLYVNSAITIGRAT